MEDSPPSAEASKPSVHPGGQLRRGLRWVLGGLLVVGLAILLALAAINSGPGRSYVARQLSATTLENGLRVQIGRIDGSLWSKAELVDVAVYDARGRFLTAPRIALDWRPLAYLRGKIDLRSAVAAAVVLERVPQLQPSTTKGPLLPDLDITIDRFTAMPPVSGERRDLRLAGTARIADQRAQVTAQATTLAVAGGGAGDRVDLVLDAVPEANRLSLRLKLDAPKSGVIAALAGLDQALSLAVTGAGDWTRWDGSAVADMAGRPLARLRLGARDGTFTATGPAELGRLLGGGVPAALLGATTQLDLTAKLAQRRAALSGSLRSDAIVLTPAGVIDLADNRFDGFKLDALLLRPAALAPNLSGRSLRAQLLLNGALARPAVQYQLSAGALAAGEIVLEGIDLRGKTQIRSGPITLPLTGRIERVRGMDSVVGGTLTRVAIAGDIAVDGPRILSDNLRIRSDRIDAKAIILADVSRGLYTGGLEGRINNYRVESVGTFAVQTTADIKRSGNGLTLVGTVRGRSSRFDSAGVRDFLGGNASGSSRIAYGPDGMIRFSQLRVSAPQLQIDGGSGSYVAGGALTLNATGRSTRYGPLAVAVTGTLARPRAVVLARQPGMGVGLANVRAEVTGGQGTYRVKATGLTDYGPLSTDATVRQGRALTIDVHRGDLGGIGFAGRLVQTGAGPFVGQLDAQGNGLVGLIRLTAAGRYQEALIHAQATDTVLPGPANVAIGNGTVDARLVFYAKPLIEADVQLARSRYRGFEIAAARSQINYRDGNGQIRFLTEGVSSVPFRLAGNVELTPGLWRAALDGRVRGIAFRTASPARVIPGKTGYELLPTRVDFGDGSMRLAGRYGRGIRLESRLDRMDLALINAFVPGYGLGGKATGSLDFEQSSPTAFPRADARLSITDFSRTTAAAVSVPVDVNFVGQLLADGGEGRAVIRHRGTVIGRLNAVLKPLEPGAGSWVTRVMAAPLGGGIRYNGPAETLWSFVGQPDQELSGSIAIGADFTGRLRQPQLTGVVRSEGLVYENATYGTRLTKMAVNGRFVGDALQVEQFSAQAGPGRISGTGTVSLSQANGYPLDMVFDLDNAQLAQSDTISSQATGQVRLQKRSGENALLSGTLLLPETHYELVRQSASDVPELSGVRFKPPRGRLRITGNEPAMAQSGLLDGLRLDLRVSAPNRLFVTGMGLDSEWSADLRVGGTNTVPLVSGDIELVRGEIGFAGRQFKLQEGRLLFTGAGFSDSQIVLSAVEEIDDIEVRVAASGNAFNPQITFTSTPQLPQDEVLSRILFGNSVGQLSPLQALQLAASLNSLRATGGGLNPLGKLRAATGISRLRILSADEKTGRGTAIAAGRYITNDIFLEVVTDARGFTATQIEVSLTPTLSILSQAGGAGITSFSVRYRKRY
ncbi:MAG: translocation/assembly module TamB domain-containing protein [Sphingomonadales bacterium]|nr:translocation/assembly module TamB domain-containing protein [Sphingomonadales bacterium]